MPDAPIWLGPPGPPYIMSEGEFFVPGRDTAYWCTLEELLQHPTWEMPVLCGDEGQITWRDCGVELFRRVIDPLLARGDASMFRLFYSFYG